ncbi:MAG: UbiA prenyltransferase family protein [Thermoplasmatales archaeon]|nr:UbiA prenyltransferase family protein [Thermoplasmatales archaeon]
MKKIFSYSKLIRLPGLGGLAIPPVFGAISVGVYDFYSLALLFIIGAVSAIYGFVLNDYADVELDSLVPELRGKPIVSGEISRKNAIAVCFFSVLIAFLSITILWRGKVIDELKFSAFVSIFLAGVLGSIYNLYGKKIAGSDFFVAISMSFVFLFGALSFDKPNLLTWIIFILTFEQTLHMNAIEGGIKDADHDFLMGVKNIALTSGLKVEKNKIFIPMSFKLFGFLLRLSSAILIFIPFIYGLNYDIWQISLLILLTLSFLYIEIRFLSIKEFDRAKIRKMISSAAFIRYAVVPIMLVSKIGFLGIFLAIFPISWYIAFVPLTGVKPFQPEM